MQINTAHQQWLQQCMQTIAYIKTHLDSVSCSAATTRMKDALQHLELHPTQKAVEALLDVADSLEEPLTFIHIITAPLYRIKVFTDQVVRGRGTGSRPISRLLYHQLTYVCIFSSNVH